MRHSCNYKVKTEYKNKSADKCPLSFRPRTMNLRSSPAQAIYYQEKIYKFRFITQVPCDLEEKNVIYFRFNS